MQLMTLSGLFAQIQTDPVSAAISSRGMVLAVLVMLVLMSVLSWFIIGARAWALVQLRRQIEEFRLEFRKVNDLAIAAEQLKRFVTVPHFKLMIAVLKEIASDPFGEDDPDLETLERAMRRSSEPLVEEMESGLAVLGTIASAAPFIGLFGTVWGIMMAFGDLSDTGSVLQKIAPHIAQALVATAVGLLAAIPAVIAFNTLGRMVRTLISDLDGFGLDLLNHVQRKARRHAAASVDAA